MERMERLSYRQYERSVVNYLVAGLIVYTLIFLSASYLRAFGMGTDTYWTTIFGVIAGVAVLWFFFRDLLPLRTVFSRKRRMTVSDFLQFFCVFAAGQFLFTVLNVLMEYCLNLIGFSIYTSVALSTGASTDVSRLLYTSLLVPVTEELIYRGLCLQFLQRFGKVFAIVFSAFLFGVMHANLPQAPFAFYIGLILGLVATEYSIFYAMLLHFINNFFFGEMLEKILRPLALPLQDHIYVLIFGTFFVVASGIILMRRKDIARYIATHRAPAHTYRYALTSVATVAFFILHFTRALLLLDRI